MAYKSICPWFSCGYKQFYKINCYTASARRAKGGVLVSACASVRPCVRPSVRPCQKMSSRKFDFCAVLLPRSALRAPMLFLDFEIHFLAFNCKNSKKFRKFQIVSSPSVLL